MASATESLRLPDRLRQLRWRTWRGILWRAGVGFVNDNCSDWAASLTYYSVLSLFPSAIVIVALVGLVSEGQAAVDTILDILYDLGARSLLDNESFTTFIHDTVLGQTSAGALLSFGVIGALWSASGYVGGFTRASNAIYGVEEGRPWWKLRPLQILLTAAALLLLSIGAFGLAISGPIADAVGEALHLGDTPLRIWGFAKWPVLVLVGMLLLALLFWIAPNVRQPKFRWLTVGGFVTLLAAALVSFGFGLYVANFGSYDRTYGSLGAVIAFLVWLYLINSAVMLGVEINAQVARGRALQGGVEDPDPPLPPKDPAG
ncbi:YihY/virulence factor BrkB family protein [Catenuloplanes indicus]|uniref:Membrane protein n=1 Tax=Catenuloplanes indicus TaxID=137267 RepID=A0AAE3W5R0_9ACTN|nr:YihY/virulence factor BrkB family protein [Catenuloplanes indicus]MDQ0369777.1 membrane protein [Catenuloplanes indicus]